ncbi:MAG: TolC family protein [Desulfoplanes sp.]
MRYTTTCSIKVKYARQISTFCQRVLFPKSVLLGFIGLLIYGAFPGVAMALESGELGMAQAVQLAVEHSQDLKAAHKSVRYSSLSMEKEKNDYLPQVTGTLDNRVTSNYGDSRAERDAYSSNVGVAISLNLFKGFADEASLESARQELSSSAYTALRQEQQVIFDTASAYLNVVKQSKAIDIATQNLVYNRQKEKQIKAFYDAGKIPVTDLYQQRAETADATSELITARNTLKKGWLELANLMGTEDFNRAGIQMPAIDIAAVAGEINNNSLIRIALTTRPDLLALEKNIAAKQAGIREAQSGKYPSVDLNAGVADYYAYQHEKDSGMGSGGGNLNSYVGVTVSVPLFDKHLTRTRTEQARIDKQTAVLFLEKLKEQIRLELGEAVADYKSACETINATKTRRLYAEKALESAKQRYRVGKSGLTELIQMRSDLVEADNNLIEAQINQLLKIVSIFFYRGDLGLSHLLLHQVGEKLS